MVSWVMFLCDVLLGRVYSGQKALGGFILFFFFLGGGALLGF